MYTRVLSAGEISEIYANGTVPTVTVPTLDTAVTLTGPTTIVLNASANGAATTFNATASAMLGNFTNSGIGTITGGSGTATIGVTVTLTGAIPPGIPGSLVLSASNSAGDRTGTLTVAAGTFSNATFAIPAANATFSAMTSSTASLTLATAGLPIDPWMGLGTLVIDPGLTGLTNNQTVSFSIKTTDLAIVMAPGQTYTFNSTAVLLSLTIPVNATVGTPFTATVAASDGTKAFGTLTVNGTGLILTSGTYSGTTTLAMLSNATQVSLTATPTVAGAIVVSATAPNFTGYSGTITSTAVPVPSWSSYTIPVVKSPQFLSFVASVITTRINYCLGTRPTTYYFSQSTGNDANSGSIAHPFQTLAKAQSLAADNVALCFAMGDTWNESQGLHVEGFENLLVTKYLPTGSQATALPVFEGGGANTAGILFSGDGSAVVGINAHEWGTGTGQNYPIECTASGDACCIVKDCMAFTTAGPHAIGLYNNGSGGKLTVADCIAGIGSTNNNTVINGFADGGGQEFIADGNTITGGGPSAIGVYGHTVTGTAALLLSRNTTIKASPNQVRFAVAFGNTFNNSWNPQTARAFEINTVIEASAGNACTSITGLTNGVRIGGVYHMRPAAVDGTRAWGYASTQSIVYDSEYVVDLSLSDTADRIGACNGTPGFKWENVHLHYSAAPDTYIAITYGGAYGNGNAVVAGTSLENCIFTNGSGKLHVLVGCGQDTVTANGNAYHGIWDYFGSGIHYDCVPYVDAHPINLTSIVAPLTVPASGDQLWGEAVLPTDGVPMGYDVNLAARGAKVSVGPVQGAAWTVGGMRNRGQRFLLNRNRGRIG